MRLALSCLVTVLFVGCQVTETEVGDPLEPPVEVPPISGTDACAANIDVTGPMRTKLSCEAFCLPDTAPRSSIMRVTWDDDRRGKPGESRLDTTVYKTGFEEVAYLSFCAAPAPQQPAATSLSPTVHMTVIEQERSMQLRVLENRKARRFGEQNEVVVADLEPGINYLWRAVQWTGNGWVESESVSCAAAVCPVDYVEEAVRPGKKKPPRKRPDDYDSPAQQPDDESVPGKDRP